MPDRTIENDPLFLNPELTALYDVVASWEGEILIDDLPVRRREAELDFYLPKVMAANSVLDVGCGTGELLRLARRAGHPGRLAGVEPAGPMLEIAKRRSDIEWAPGEADAGGWDAEFDLAIMTGHAFQCVLTDRGVPRMLAAVRRALVRDGRFVFDTRNPLVRDWETWTPDVVLEFVAPDGARVRKWHELVSVDGDLVAYSTTYESDSWDEAVTFQSAQRFYSAADVAAFLSGAGLVIEEQYGHWDGRPLTDTSPEIITIARRVT